MDRKNTRCIGAHSEIVGGHKTFNDHSLVNLLLCTVEVKTTPCNNKIQKPFFRYVNAGI